HASRNHGGNMGTARFAKTSAQVQMGTRDCSRRARGFARRFYLWPMGLLRKLLSASRRVWRAGVADGGRGFAFGRRFTDRGSSRWALPARRGWLRFFDGMGPRFRHLLVVFWSSDAFPCGRGPASGLVGGPGQEPVWFAGGSHSLWTVARRYLRSF